MADRRRRRRVSSHSDSDHSEEDVPPVTVVAEKPRRPSLCESEGGEEEEVVSEYESANEEKRDRKADEEEEEDDEEEDDDDEDEDESEDEEDEEEEDDDEDVIVEDEQESLIDEERGSGDGEEQPEKSSEKLDDDEDKQNPAYIPRKGAFYEHDSRTTEEFADDSRPKKTLWKDASKWEHDKFRPEMQAPKSREELIAEYGYDIRAYDRPPDAPRRNTKNRDRPLQRRNKLSDYMQRDGSPPERYNIDGENESQRPRYNQSRPFRRPGGRRMGQRYSEGRNYNSNQDETSQDARFSNQEDRYEYNNKDRYQNYYNKEKQSYSNNHDGRRSYSNQEGSNTQTYQEGGSPNNNTEGRSYGSQDARYSYNEDSPRSYNKYDFQSNQESKRSYSSLRESRRGGGGSKSQPQSGPRQWTNSSYRNNSGSKENINYKESNYNRHGNRYSDRKHQAPEVQVLEPGEYDIPDDSDTVYTTIITTKNSPVSSSERKSYSRERRGKVGKTRVQDTLPMVEQQIQKVTITTGPGTSPQATSPAPKSAPEPTTRPANPPRKITTQATTGPSASNKAERKPSGNNATPQSQPKMEATAGQSRTKRYSSQRQRNVPDSGFQEPVVEGNHPFYRPGGFGPQGVYHPRPADQSPPHQASNFPQQTMMQQPVAFPVPTVTGPSAMPTGPRVFNAPPPASIAAAQPLIPAQAFMAAPVMSYGAPPPGPPPPHYQMAAPVAPVAMPPPPHPPPPQGFPSPPQHIEVQTRAGSTTYYNPEAQHSLGKMQEPHGGYTQGGTVYFSPDVQQPSPHRSPARRPKVPLPIVNPQDIRYGRGQQERLEEINEERSPGASESEFLQGDGPSEQETYQDMQDRVPDYELQSEALPDVHEAQSHEHRQEIETNSKYVEERPSPVQQALESSKQDIKPESQSSESVSEGLRSDPVNEAEKSSKETSIDQSLDSSGQSKKESEATVNTTTEEADTAK